MVAHAFDTYKSYPKIPKVLANSTQVLKIEELFTFWPAKPKYIIAHSITLHDHTS